jgi:hypothetical protein
LDAGLNYALSFEGSDFTITGLPPAIEQPEADDPGPTLVLLENAQEILQSLACGAGEGSGAGVELPPADPLERALQSAASVIEETACD